MNNDMFLFGLQVPIPYPITFRTSLIITFVGEGTSIFSGFVVFTVLGFMAHELKVPVEDVVKSGTNNSQIRWFKMGSKMLFFPISAYT